MTVSDQTTDDIELFAKAFCPIDVILDKSIDGNAVQFSKALLPIVVMFDRFIEDKEVQFANPHPSIVVHVVGNTIYYKLEQPLNAPMHIVAILVLSIFTCVRDELFLWQFGTMRGLAVGYSIDVKREHPSKVLDWLGALPKYLYSLKDVMLLLPKTLPENSVIYPSYSLVIPSAPLPH